MKTIKTLSVVIFFNTTLMLHASEWFTFTRSNSPLPSDWILSLAKENNNTIWIGTFGWQTAGQGGAVKIVSSGWTVYDTANSGLKDNSVVSLVVDNNNVKWFGCAFKLDGFTGQVYDSGGTSKFDGNNWTSWQFSFPFWGDNIKDMALDPGSNNIWTAIGTFYFTGNPIHGTVARFNGSSWNFYTRSFFNLPNNNSFHSIVVDNNGIIWIGTINNGLIRFDGSAFTKFTMSNSPIPSNNIYELEVAPDGKLWIGCDGGLAKFDGTNWSVYRTDNSGLPFPMVMSIAFENSYIWVGTLDGMARFDGNDSWIRYDTSNCPIPGGVVDVLLVDNAGNKWIGTRDFTIAYGLTVFNEGGITGINPEVFEPDQFTLKQNYPNPFNPVTKIDFVLPEAGFTSLKIYNTEGKEVDIILGMNLNKGAYTYSWDGSKLPSGVYFYTLKTEKQFETRKMLLIK